MRRPEQPQAARPGYSVNVASALALARNTFGFVRTEDGALRAAAERMRACYVALDRGFLVDRVDRFLRG